MKRLTFEFPSEVSDLAAALEHLYGLRIRVVVDAVTARNSRRIRPVVWRFIINTLNNKYNRNIFMYICSIHGLQEEENVKVLNPAIAMGCHRSPLQVKEE